MINLIATLSSVFGTNILAQASSGISGLLNVMDQVVTQAIDWIGDFITSITASGHEILLWGLIISAVGLGIGLIKRIMRL